MPIGLIGFVNTLSFFTVNPPLQNMVPCVVSIVMRVATIDPPGPGCGAWIQLIPNGVRTTESKPRAMVKLSDRIIGEVKVVAVVAPKDVEPALRPWTIVEPLTEREPLEIPSVTLRVFVWVLLETVNESTDK